jgi:hypothetical protein
MLKKLTVLSALVLGGCHAAPPKTPDIGDEELESSESGADVESAEPAEVVPEDNDEEGMDETAVTSPVEPIALTADVIKQLCASNAKLTKTEALVVPARTNQCSFGSAPNVAAKADTITAREVDEVAVALTQDMVLCDVAVTSSATNLAHNDDLYFLMDKYVILADAGQKTAMFDKVGELFVWNFAKIVNTAYVSSANKTLYCAGGQGTCLAEETNGTFRASATVAQLATMSSELVMKDALKFSVITTGDDNNGDCTHTAMPLDVEISYIANPNVAPVITP